jgi:XTP/dITP diphosphohydrolase
MMKIVFASNNLSKARELFALLENINLELISQSAFLVDEIEETGLTFVENALLKARHASAITGLPAIADDSGLIVTALNGAPGIYSARYAGKKTDARKNIEKLLTDLQDVPEPERDAAFHCTLVYLAHPLDPTPLICEGTWKGFILKHATGEQGFGYDPVFYDSYQKCSAAELPLDVKNRISHRGQALQLLLKKLPEKLCLHSL